MITKSKCILSLSRFRNGINIFFFPSFLTAGCEFSVPIRARFACCCNRGGFSSPSSYPDRGNSRRNYHSLKERKENPEVAVAKNTVYRPPAGGVEEDESLGSFFLSSLLLLHTGNKTPAGALLWMVPDCWFHWHFLSVQHKRGPLCSATAGLRCAEKKRWKSVIAGPEKQSQHR